MNKNEQRLFAVPKLHPIGHLGKPHGVRGEISAHLSIRPDTLWAHLQEEPRYLFVERNGLPVPYRIEAYRTKGEQTYLLTLRGINDREIASQIVHADIAITQEEIDRIEIEFTWDHFIGFEVRQEQGETIGIVSYVQDETANILFEVETAEQRHILLPVHEELITDIDTEQRAITLRIPKGLLEI